MVDNFELNENYESTTFVKEILNDDKLFLKGTQLEMTNNNDENLKNENNIKIIENEIPQNQNINIKNNIENEINSESNKINFTNDINNLENNQINKNNNENNNVQSTNINNLIENNNLNNKKEVIDFNDEINNEMENEKIELKLKYKTMLSNSILINQLILDNENEINYIYLIKHLIIILNRY